MKKVFFLLVLLYSANITAQVLPRKSDINVKGFVVDADSKKKMKANVTIIGHPSLDTIYYKTVEADSGFSFRIPKDHPDESFTCWVDYVSYNAFMCGVPYFSQKEINLVYLKRFTGGAKTVLFNSIHFDYDQSLVNTSSKKLLDSAVTYLKKYPEVNIEIEGHTDNMGTDDYNLPLSQLRADEVKDYLTVKGIDIKRIKKCTGVGASKPVDSNETDDGKAKNRRVEIRLVK